MDKPLTIWYCDVCGQPLEANEGIAIFRRDEHGKLFDFKIVHQGDCDLGNEYLWLHLNSLLGEKGKEKLLSFLSPGMVKVNLEGKHGTFPRVKDFDEFVDFFRRCQTPYYEEARRYFSCPDLLEWHSDNNEIAPYFSESLKEMIEQFSKICE